MNVPEWQDLSKLLACNNKVQDDETLDERTFLSPESITESLEEIEPLQSFGKGASPQNNITIYYDDLV